MYCKNTCKLTPKVVKAELSPLWCKLSSTFLLKEREANISSVIRSSTCYYGSYSLQYYQPEHCKFGNVREEFIFAKFRENKPSRNGKITLSFIDIGEPCLSGEFFTSLICRLILFAKKNLAKISESTAWPLKQ